MKGRSIFSKFFSTNKSDADEFIVANSGSVIKELIKIIVMGDRLQDVVPHWIKNLCGIINSAKNKDCSNIQVFLGIVSNYKNLPRRVSQVRIERDIRRGRSVSEYINSIYDDIKVDRRAGNNKYATILGIIESRGELPDNQTLIQKIKYVALCITGQLDPDKDDWYSSMVQSTPVNWEWSGEVDKEVLEEIIKKIL